MIYTWWILQNMEMAMEQLRMTPPRNSQSAGVSGAALNPAKAKTVIPAREIIPHDSAQEDGEAIPHERAADREVEDDNYMPPSEDEASLDDDEFVVPSDPAEQERFKRRLLATANSLKKKQQQLRADQDLLADRWTEVLAAEEYELERPSKNYPKHRPLPQSEGETHDMADRPPRGRDREACRTSKQAMPR